MHTDRVPSATLTPVRLYLAAIIVWAVLAAILTLALQAAGIHSANLLRFGAVFLAACVAVAAYAAYPGRD